MLKVKEESDIELIISVYQAQIELYSSLLNANDEKRDQFMRFYLSIVLSAVGFGALTIANGLSNSNSMMNLNNPTYSLIMLILFIVLLFGLLTYNIQLKFRIYHTQYVRLMNRNRAFMLQAIMSHYPTSGETMKKAWNEHLSDDHPPFFHTKGVEQGFSVFTAFINSLLFGFISVFLFMSYVIQIVKLSQVLSGGVVFLTSVSFLFLTQYIWMQRALSNEENKYKVQIHQNNNNNLTNQAETLKS